ncbi:FlgO family outer membrane protein [Ningiella sp. W23]|uniref:FlgO family outer membrane protein n=1 Tax=Ningiella sp. W23 TaxID=3023715 RepID=UPI00375685A6
MNNVNPVARIVHKITEPILLISAVMLLGGCAAGKMFMAGYTPPQTIADLINEQQAQVGGLPSELAFDGSQYNEIDSSDYLDSEGEHLDVTTGRSDAFSMSNFRQVESFRPRFSYKSIEDYAAQLSMDLMQNRFGLSADAKVGVSSFVKLDTSLQNTTVLGNQLAEYLIGEMQQLGLPVVDHKLMPALQVTSRGDVTFSRDVLQLSNQNVMDHVLSGTLIERPNGVYVNARIISVDSNKVVSSANIMIPGFVLDSLNMGFYSYQ